MATRQTEVFPSSKLSTQAINRDCRCHERVCACSLASLSPGRRGSLGKSSGKNPPSYRQENCSQPYSALTAEDRYHITDDGIVRFERPRQAPPTKSGNLRPALGSPASVPSRAASRQDLQQSHGPLAASVGTIVLPLSFPPRLVVGVSRHPWAPKGPGSLAGGPMSEMPQSQGAYENAILVRAMGWKN